jgi:integrase/recombinase XerC/integrase/recombinase XerD
MVVRAKNKRWQELEKDSITLERLAKHFEAYNRSEGKSPRTIEWYRRVLRFFQEYLREQNHTTRLGDLNLDVAREFVLYLQTRPKLNNHPSIPSSDGYLKAISVQNYVRGLRAFFSWLYKEGYTEENLLAHLRPPKTPQKLVDVLTEEEIAQILACLDSDTASGCRDMAILITFLDSGLRLSELTGLYLSDAHIDQGYLKVMGKGSKERIVPIGGVAQKALQRYIFHFRPDPWNGDTDYLFLTMEGRPMRTNAIQLIFSRLAKKSGVKRFHAHLCRHTFATNYLINGGDVFSLQQILGHTSLEMVRRYVTLASSQVRVQHRKFSPMDRMNLGKVKLGRAGGNGRGNGRKVKRGLVPR